MRVSPVPHRAPWEDYSGAPPRRSVQYRRAAGKFPRPDPGSRYRGTHHPENLAGKPHDSTGTAELRAAVVDLVLQPRHSAARRRLERPVLLFIPSAAELAVPGGHDRRLQEQGVDAGV